MSRATISAWLELTCPVIIKSYHLVQHSILIFDFPVRNYKSSPWSLPWAWHGAVSELNQPAFIGILSRKAMRCSEGRIRLMEFWWFGQPHAVIWFLNITVDCVVSLLVDIIHLFNPAKSLFLAVCGSRWEPHRETMYNYSPLKNSAHKLICFHGEIKCWTQNFWIFYWKSLLLPVTLIHLWYDEMGESRLLASQVHVIKKQHVILLYIDHGAL